MNWIVPLIGRATGVTLFALVLNAALALPLPTVALAEHPHPTFTPAPPEVAFAPLIATDNLVRVWRFDPATQHDGPEFGWFVFDPRPVFAIANNITLVESGQFFWIKVHNAQTTTLCEVTWELFSGQNPLICADHPHPPVTPAPPEVAFAPLFALERVWHFDPATQNWFLFDPREIIPDTYTVVSPGDFIWLLVNVNQTATICGVSRSLVAGWNPMIC